MILIIILIAFFSGVLTILAPCVLPLLPVILGGSIATKSRQYGRIIIISLIVSLFLFTILLRVSTIFIGVNPAVWEYVSGGLLIFFGITLLFPRFWSWITVKTGIEQFAQNSLEEAGKKEGIWKPIAIGAALGPVFSGCNPTYTVLLATILPVNLITGLIGLFFYFLGLGVMLFLVAHFGKIILARFAFFTNPYGLFRKLLGLLVLLVGIGIITGDVKKIETAIIEKNAFINTLSFDTTLQKYLLQGFRPSGNGKTDTVRISNFRMAPELVGVDTWINSSPLTLASLRGKVVLVDFWTYSCINCIRTQPYLNAWYEKYHNKGFEIIGVHAPEFAFEKVEANVRRAVEEAHIKYPVVLDNSFATWNAYDNHYWPAKYLIDQEGKIVYTHFGEGKYAETEKKIQELLGTSGNVQTDMQITGSENITPETYLGLSRANQMQYGENQTTGYRQLAYTFPTGKNYWTLEGGWDIQDEYIEAVAGIMPSILYLNFSAKKVYAVLSSAGLKTATIRMYGFDPPYDSSKLYEIGEFQFHGDDIYPIVTSDTFKKDTLIAISADPGVRFHTFTFGD